MVDATHSSSEDFLDNQVSCRHLIDISPDAVLIHHRGRIVLVNDECLRLLGANERDQLLGLSPLDLVPPEQLAAVEEQQRRVIEERRHVPLAETTFRRLDGVPVPVESRSVPVPRADGSTAAMVVLRDISERTRATAHLVRHRQQIEYQAQMLDQVSDAVSVLDLQGRITFWNEAAHRLFGWAAGEVLGQNSFDLLYRGDPDVLTLVRQENDAGRSWAGELTKVTRSGDTVIVEHRRTVLRDSNAVATGYLCIDIDITDRKKQQRVGHRSQRLENIGTLAGGIAHDLNNVLTPILMGAKLLASGRVPANHQGLLETMVASAGRGADLIKQLIAFAGGIQGQRSPVRMDTLIAEVRALLEHTFPKTIQLQTTVDANCPPVIGDATELSQVLMNLCINARDAMPDGGTLEIEATSIRLNGGSSRMHSDALPGLYVLVKVSDTGSGMSPAVLDRIFDPFFTTKELGKGTGLGLATTQGIVKSHGGFIIVYSEPGCGSSFSIYLPATLI